MSVEALRMIRGASRLGNGARMTATHKVILFALADRADENGQSWPSVAKLASDTCLSERAVQGALQALMGAGWVVRTMRPNSSPVYLITTPPAGYAPPQQAHPRSKCTPAADAGEGAAGAPTPPQDAHPPGAAGAPKATIEAKEEAKGKPKAERGHRLPDDWAPSVADIEFARARGLDWQHVAQQFCDHWHSSAGANARKIKWDAAWRVWCGRQNPPRYGSRAQPFAGRPTNLSLHLAPQPEWEPT